MSQDINDGQEGQKGHRQEFKYHYDADPPSQGHNQPTPRGLVVTYANQQPQETYLKKPNAPHQLITTHHHITPHHNPVTPPHTQHHSTTLVTHQVTFPMILNAFRNY